MAHFEPGGHRAPVPRPSSWPRPAGRGARGTRTSRSRRLDGRRPLPGARHRHLPARRPAAQGRPHVDGPRARGALAAARPPRARVRRGAARRRSSCGAAPPSGCSSELADAPRAARSTSSTGASRASASRSASGSAASCDRGSRACCAIPRTRARGYFDAARDRPPARRARRGPRRPHLPAVEPGDARALASRVDRWLTRHRCGSCSSSAASSPGGARAS